MNPIFAAILSEYIAPEVKIGDRIEVLVAVSRSDPVWIAGTVEHVDSSQPDDVRVNVVTTDGRRLIGCHLDSVRVAIACEDHQ